MFRDVKQSEWSREHIARHGVTLEEVREVILERRTGDSQGESEVITMTTTKGRETLPRPAEQLEEIADYYDTHAPLPDGPDGEWVHPQPMVTTSLRISGDVLTALKTEARDRGVRHTALIRSILEKHVRATGRPELSGAEAHLVEILDRLERIEERLPKPR